MNELNKEQKEKLVEALKKIKPDYQMKKLMRR